MHLIDADKLMQKVKDLSPHPLAEWETIGVLSVINQQPEVNKIYLVFQSCPDQYDDNDVWYPEAFICAATTKAAALAKAYTAAKDYAYDWMDKGEKPVFNEEDDAWVIGDQVFDVRETSI